MNSLLGRVLSFSSSSSGRTSDLKNIVNSEKFVIEDFNKVIDNWELPKVNKEMIYKTKRLDFLKNDYVIKTEERDITFSNPFETIHLFSEKSLRKLKEKNFNYIHIGLIQIEIKPLTKEGLDTYITISLKDKNILKSMILQIKTHNYNMIEGSVPVALIFKISYKVMISSFSTQHKFQ